MIATRTTTAASATAALCAALLLGATACSSTPSGPTSDVAGKRMSKDAHRLLGQMQGLLNAPQPYTVSKDSASAAGASKCGKGKEKRLFAAKMQVPVTPNVHTALVVDEGSANGFLVQDGYSLDVDASKPQSDAQRSATMVDKKGRVHLNVVLTPAPGGKLINYVVTGTTDCLHVAS